MFFWVRSFAVVQIVSYSYWWAFWPIVVVLHLIASWKKNFNSFFEGKKTSIEILEEITEENILIFVFIGWHLSCSIHFNFRCIEEKKVTSKMDIQTDPVTITDEENLPLLTSDNVIIRARCMLQRSNSIIWESLVISSVYVMDHGCRSDHQCCHWCKCLKYLNVIEKMFCPY